MRRAFVVYTAKTRLSGSAASTAVHHGFDLIGIETVCGVQRLDGVVELIERHERGDTNLGGRNHQHVDALIAQGLEELGGQTGMGLHANAHHGHLAHVGVHIEGVVARPIRAR